MTQTRASDLTDLPALATPHHDKSRRMGAADLQGGRNQ